MGWLSRPALVGSLQQTRGMKVHSSVKKRCEHCKVGWNWIINSFGSFQKGQFMANDQICRLFDERQESDTTDTCTSSARRTLDTSSDRAKAIAIFSSAFFDNGEV
jgi:hypothetical protein